MFEVVKIQGCAGSSLKWNSIAHSNKKRPTKTFFHQKETFHTCPKIKHFFLALVEITDFLTKEKVCYTYLENPILNPKKKVLISPQKTIF